MTISTEVFSTVDKGILLKNSDFKMGTMFPSSHTLA